MVLSLAETNHTLTFLKDLHLDRYFLNDFSNTDSITTTKKQVPVIVDEAIYHDKFFLLSDVEDVIFKFANADMRPFNKLEILIFSEDVIDLEGLTLYFSEYANADFPMEYANLNAGETVINNGLYSLTFDLKDEDGALYYLPSVKSIKLLLGNELSKIKIANIMLKTNKYELSFDELEPAIDDARKYISKRINESTVHPTLEDEVPKKAASMLWLISRQGKGDSNVGVEGMRFTPSNFHDKLKKEVDEAIDNYLYKKKINTKKFGLVGLS